MQKLILSLWCAVNIVVCEPSFAQFVPPFINFVSASGVQKTVKIPTGTTSFIIPTDYGSLVKIVGIGAGGGGHDGAGSFQAEGACSGAYSEQTVDPGFSAGQTVTVNVPAGGTHGNPGTVGGDVYFCKATSSCASIAGANVVMGAKGGNPGNSFSAALCTPASAASGVGSTKFDGGVGGVNSAGGGTGGSGAGAAGPHGAGKNAGGSVTSSASGGGGGTDGGTSGLSSTVGPTPGTGGNNFLSVKVGADGVINGANGNNGVSGDQFVVTATAESVGSGGGCSAGGGITGAELPGTPGKYGAGGCGGGSVGVGSNGADGLLLFIYLTK